MTMTLGNTNFVGDILAPVLWNDSLDLPNLHQVSGCSENFRHVDRGKQLFNEKSKIQVGDLSAPTIVQPAKLKSRKIKVNTVNFCNNCLIVK